MKPNSTNFLTYLFLSKYRIFRYFLLIKLLQTYYPDLQNQYAPIKEAIIKNWRRKPYSFLTIAFIAGLVLSRFIKNK